jgi:hypothetical protein
VFFKHFNGFEFMDFKHMSHKSHGARLPGSALKVSVVGRFCIEEHVEQLEIKPKDDITAVNDFENRPRGYN